MLARKLSAILAHRAGHFGLRVKAECSVILREMLNVDGGGFFSETDVRRVVSHGDRSRFSLIDDVCAGQLTAPTEASPWIRPPSRTSRCSTTRTSPRKSAARRCRGGHAPSPPTVDDSEGASALRSDSDLPAASFWEGIPDERC